MSLFLFSSWKMDRIRRLGKSKSSSDKFKGEFLSLSSLKWVYIWCLFISRQNWAGELIMRQQILINKFILLRLSKINEFLYGDFFIFIFTFIFLYFYFYFIFLLQCLGTKHSFENQGSMFKRFSKFFFSFLPTALSE